MKLRILFAEDDDCFAFVLKDHLELNGYEVIHVSNGENALKLFKKEKFDLCLLDVMMPAVDGFSVAKEIRMLNKAIPVLFISAKSMKEDRIQGFKTGGDDFITKPFSVEELLMRIAVFLRRSGLSEVEPFYKFGLFTFDYKNLKLTSPKEIFTLTQKEGDILRFFCTHQNQLIKREDMLKELWGDDDYFMGRSMDVFIAKLRKYLKEDSTICIRNVHGVGFQFVV